MKIAPILYLRCLLGLLIALTLGACASNRNLMIDIREPAKITLPLDVADVLIVNNTLPQPAEAGIEISLDRERQNIPLTTDSLAWYTAEAFASTLSEAGFFDEVALYNLPLRQDKEWLATVPLSDKLKEEAFDTENFDAIISIDKVLFTLTDSVRRNMVTASQSEYSVYVAARADVRAVCSIHLRADDSVFAMVSHSDSTIFKSAVTADPQYIFYTLPQAILADLSYKLGEELTTYFAPTWYSVQRTIYTTSGARMQEAAQLANNNNFIAAAVIWQSEYNKISKPSEKAQIAMNLAFAAEMNDNFARALDWATEARSLWEASQESGFAKDALYTQNYIRQIEKRISDNAALNRQFGIE